MASSLAISKSFEASSTVSSTAFSKWPRSCFEASEAASRRARIELEVLPKWPRRGLEASQAASKQARSGLEASEVASQRARSSLEVASKWPRSERSGSEASFFEFTRGPSGSEASLLEFSRAKWPLEEPPQVTGNQRNLSPGNSKVLSIASSMD